MAARVTVIAATILLTANWIGDAQAEIMWGTDIGSAQRLAAASDKLVLIHFYTPDCVPCKRLEHEVFTLPSVEQVVHDFFVPVKVNARQAATTALNYQVEEWPTDVIITPDGEVVRRQTSPEDPRVYLQHLTQASANAAQVMSIATNGRSAARTGMPASQGSSQFYGREEHGVNAREQATVAAGQVGSKLNTGPVGMADNSQDIVNRFARQSRTGALKAVSTNDVPASASAIPQQQVDMIAAQAAAGVMDQQQLSAQPYDSRQSSWRDGSAWGADSVTQMDRQSPPSDIGPIAGANDNWDARDSTVAKRAGGAAATKTVTRRPNPPIGIEGYCCVTLGEETKWEKGDPRFGVIHRGRTYLFVGQAEKEKFLVDPDSYSPVLSGIDPVAFAERGTVVVGKRKHGAFYDKHVYLFADEAALNTFWKSPEKYMTVVQQALQPDSGKVLR